MPSDLLLDVHANLVGSTKVTTRWSELGELVVTDREDRWSMLVVEQSLAGERMVVFIAQVCDERLVEAERVLRLAGQLGAGSLALVGASYVVRYCIPAAHAITADCERIALYVSNAASSLRDLVIATRRDVSAVSHLAL